MKKIISILFTFVAAILLFSCTTDRGEVPVLNSNAVSKPVIKTTLGSSYVITGDNLTLPFAGGIVITPATYSINVPLTNQVEISTSSDFAAASTVAVGAPTVDDTVAVLYKDMNTALALLGAAPGTVSKVYLRVKTAVAAIQGSPNLQLYPSYSDVVSFDITAFSSTNMPNLWYIIGLANEAWTYSKNGIGVSIIPLSLIAGNTYKPSTDGAYTYTGYFQASKGFKIVSGKESDMGTWQVQWGSADGSITNLVFKDGGSKNINVPADGYYTIKLDATVTPNTCTIVPATVHPVGFNRIGLIGEFNGWGGDVFLTPCDATLGTNNHIWYLQGYTFAANFTPPVGNGGCKFRANADWVTNWGAGVFPFGLGTGGGTNIPFEAGTYTVVFNDIDGCFYFMN